MSRLDNLGEILDGYEGREHTIMRLLELQEIRQKLSAGYEDHNRAGLLVGECLADGNISVFEVIIPKQESKQGFTKVKDWSAAIRKAESIGEIVGYITYVGTKPAIVGFSSDILKSYEELCKMHDLPDCNAVINDKGEVGYRSTTRIITPKQK